MLSTSNIVLCYMMISFQAPSQSMKLKDLKVAVEEHSNVVFSSFSGRREALLFLKKKVCIITWLILSADRNEPVFLPVFFKLYLAMYLLWSICIITSVTSNAYVFLFVWVVVIYPWVVFYAWGVAYTIMSLGWFPFLLVVFLSFKEAGNSMWTARKFSSCHESQANRNSLRCWCPALVFVVARGSKQM